MIILGMSQDFDERTNLWIDNYTTTKTRESARTSVHAWNRYLSDNGINEYALIKQIKESDDDTRYHEINKFIKSLGIMPASIRQYQNFVRGYLRSVHGIKTTHEDFRQIVKLPKVIKVNREPLTKEIIQQLVRNSDDIRKAWYLLLSSSGMRASESLSLQEENFDFDSKPVSVFISGATTKTQTDRITFVSNETIKYIEKCGSDFWQPRRLIPEEIYFNRLRKKLNLLEKYQNTRNYKVNIHAFRAFFRTIAGELNQDFAEHLIGHGYLKQYVRPTKEKLKEQYLKIEKNLKIF